MRVVGDVAADAATRIGHERIPAMAMRDIRVTGDPVLRTVCDPITDIDDRVRTLVEDLLETVDYEGRAGLAANQIGVSLRAFSWNIDGEIGYILNPVIVERATEFQEPGRGGLPLGSRPVVPVRAARLHQGDRYRPRRQGSRHRGRGDLGPPHQPRGRPPRRPPVPRPARQGCAQARHA
ncbi:hypothetical protein GCM10025876_03350 [Demequina litorisediminis]|uniref:Peptide deformylase n=1 Tax=Demequina litorisediminis TaxID=1849022 RepID=A0ABQ6I9K1_9MICO|nr:hypothetical protein GCM10025876_03350 [Demequina litorisediminis]